MPPKFRVGDVVRERAGLAGETVSGQRFKVLAVYGSLLGYWYAVEAVGGLNPGDQVSINERGSYGLVSRKTKPITRFWHWITRASQKGGSSS